MVTSYNSLVELFTSSILYLSRPPNMGFPRNQASNQICGGGALHTFDSLKTQYFLANYLFQYLQLRHAFHLRFSTRAVFFTVLGIESLLRDDSLVKPLSTIYNALHPNKHEGLDKLLECWHEEVLELDSKYWEDIWDYPMQQLVSTRDRLIPFKISHRIFLPPKNCTGFTPRTH